MKQVNAYKTEDGKLFESKVNAQRHEIKEAIRKEFKIVPSHKNSFDKYRNCDIETIAEFIAENNGKVRDILNNASGSNSLIADEFVGN